MALSPQQFCCGRKCFVAPRCEVDGLACRVCYTFCYCQCRCESLPPRVYGCSLADDTPRRCVFWRAKNGRELCRFETRTPQFGVGDLRYVQLQRDGTFSATFVGAVSSAELHLHRVWQKCANEA